MGGIGPGTIASPSGRRKALCEARVAEQTRRMGRRPDSPGELAPRAWRYALRRCIRDFFAHRSLDRAAALTFYGVVALFPAMLVAASALALFGQRGSAVRAVLDLAEDVAPAEVLVALREQLLEFASSPSVGLGFVTGLVLGLWSASAYVAAFGRAVNAVYGVAEGRPVWKLRPFQLLVTAVVLGVALVIVLVLLVSGPVARIAAATLGLSEALQTAWAILRWPLLAAALVCLVAVLYHATPNVRQPRFRWLSLGALAAIVVIVIASAAFALFLRNFADYDRVYGSLAGAVIFLLWLWIANGALLFGAQFDAELERARELQSGAPAEERILLAPKDTRRIARDAAKHAEDVARGRRLRDGAGR